ncbi:MAG: hypothetical protein K6F52_06730 [Clostridia bacterium]|nr:hypothetical protein [Clostridia bacterium]
MCKLGENFAKEIKLISDAARSLRILAINARIETAKAESYFSNCAKVISDSMAIQAKLVALLVERYEGNSAILNEVLTRSGFKDIFVTDEKGIVICSVPASLCGKNMYDLSILSKVEAEPHILELPEKDLNDGEMEKTVITLRKDCKGIVQIKSRYRPSEGICTVRSFSVVAEEIGKLARTMEDNIAIVEATLIEVRGVQEKIDVLEKETEEHEGMAEGSADKAEEIFDADDSQADESEETAIPEETVENIDEAYASSEISEVVAPEVKADSAEEPAADRETADTDEDADAELSEEELELKKFKEEFMKMSELEQRRKMIDLKTEYTDKYKTLKNVVDDLNQNARLANLLAIRAKIESAQASNDNGTLDRLLGVHMEIQIKVLKQYVAEQIMTFEEVADMCNFTGIDEVWNTDNTGTVVFCNAPGGIGFQFKNEGQTAPYMAILNNQDLVVTAPQQKRALDGKVMKYLGTGNFSGGILQIGLHADFTGDKASMGFSNVAIDARKIAENVLAASKYISQELTKS